MLKASLVSDELERPFQVSEEREREKGAFDVTPLLGSAPQRLKLAMSRVYEYGVTESCRTTGVDTI